MSDATKPEEPKEVKETPRSTAEADFTKYKVSMAEFCVFTPQDLIRVTCSLGYPFHSSCRLPRISSMLR